MFKPAFFILSATALVLAAGCERPPAVPVPATSPAPAPVTNSAPESQSLGAGAAAFDVLAALLRRGEEQRALLKQTALSHDFKFTDRIAESGIKFEHGVVDDAGKNWVPGHYDHGSGIAVADVDGDGLPDIYFVNQQGGSALYRNAGRGRFEDITAAAGVALAERVGVAASFADVDNDGDPDLFVTTTRMGNVLFENLGGGRFRDITAEAGLAYSGHSSGAVFFDFDNDGLLDLFVANVGRFTRTERGRGGFHLTADEAFLGHLHPDRVETSILYRNLGGRKFRDVSREMNLVDTSWSGDATACDVNGDGWPDLYVTNMQGDDHFYLNLGGRRFEDRTAEYFPKTPWGAMCAKFFDFNQDGLPDLYVVDMHSDMTDKQTADGRSEAGLSWEKAKSEKYCAVEWSEKVLQGSSNNVFGNALHLNTGRPPFEEVSERANAETYWPWGMSAGDLNADGFEDLFITAGMGHSFRYGINSILLNDAGRRFADAEFALGVEPRAGGRIEKDYFTLDCAGADREHPLCAGRNRPLTIIGTVSSRSSVVFDLDGDGDLDIVTNEMNDRPQFLLSDLAQRRPVHFLQIRLRGSRGNRDGLGATVKVTAGGRTWTQFMDGKSGYLSQSSLPLYFGLGAAAKAERVEIIWPGGRGQAVTEGIPANATLTVIEEAK
jgi:enediyne biosynthesis protein E4